MTQKELRKHKEAAKILLALADEQLDRLVKDGDFIEV
ncbi:MAG: type II toxin-antitoxin system RelE/ParE family toxin [Treponema sp.]|nr:type II toxin-antitoxin system RelE/ParE family toxin [Treponema sp.]